MFGMSIYARLAIVLLIVGSIAGAWWKFDRMLVKADAAGYARRTQEDAATAELQRETNRANSRVAETTYAKKAEARDRFLSATTKELHDASAPLAAVPVPEPVRVRLNAAREFASQDRPASCGSGVELPSP